MEPYLLNIIEFLSLVIGLIGIAIIFTGGIKAFISYLKKPYGDFQSPRLELGSHTILGLDFLVGKDIIDTLLLDKGAEFWTDLAGLMVVVFIRIILTHFMIKEIREIKKSNG